jgi:hypothetical protein
MSYKNVFNRRLHVGNFSRAENVIPGLGRFQPLRFRRWINISPGVWVNLSKTGASVSAGVPGATVNANKRGKRATLGVPGTGISARTETCGWGKIFKFLGL